MTSFLHVLLLPLLFGLSVQDVVKNTGCTNVNQYNIPENSPAGTELIIYSNIANITLSGVYASKFHVIAKGGNKSAVTSHTPFDYETLKLPPIIMVPFICTPMTGQVVTGDLTFIVSNIIETPPDFGNDTTAYFYIPENSPNNTQVGTLHVTVAEGDSTTIVTFRLTDTGTPFRVGWPPNNTPGRYQTAVISVHEPALLDNEKTAYYTLTVTATVLDTNMISTATVYINVTNVDDMPPQFVQRDGYAVSIHEAKYQEHNITRMVAVDGDAGQNPIVLYSLIRVFPSTSLFRVVNTTGDVIVSGDMDRETCDHYLLLVKAYQVDKPDVRMDVTTLNVTVVDVDDNPPVMTRTQYTIQIPENTPTGVDVLTVTATDADKGRNAEFQYKIANQGNHDAFSVNATSGLVSVRNGSFLDRESQANLSVRVFAESMLNSSMRSRDTVVSVNLLDENDNSPEFNAKHYTFTANKTLSIPGHIGTVLAIDVDASMNGIVTYHLEGEESGRFNISNVQGSGLIQVVGPLDFNYKPWYRFTVIARDMGSSEPRQTSSQVDVHVIDVNVNTPVFVNMSTSISIREDIDVGREVLLLQASDEDTSNNLTFMLGHVSDFKLHRVDTRRSQIVINKALDRETRPGGYNLTVMVTDSEHTSTATLSVTIEDVNDNAPVFQPSSYTFNVDEEVSPKMMGNVTATDKDLLANGMLNYTIVSPWDENFGVTQTGQISVTSNLDRELLNATSGQITLLVMAEDKGTPPLMATATVTVHVGDVNDHAPVFRESEKNIIIDEGKNVSCQLQAYDEDVGINGRIYYNITLTNTSSMEIAHGMLRSKAALTYGVYEVDVIAYNSVPYKHSGLINGALSVFIHVKDINDHQPTFDQRSYSFSLSEDFKVGELLNKSLSGIHAEDHDNTPEYNTVTYNMVHGDGYFEVDPSSAALRLIKPLDYEDKTLITFQVMASDGDASHKAVVNVTVAVLDVNDHAPVFSSDLYNCSVKENTTLTLACPVPIHASDNDTEGDNGRLTFLIDGYMKNVFTMNATTGTIHPTSPLDADAGPRVYVIQIQVMDNGSPQYSDSAVVEVTVKDTNDNSPVIHGPSQFTIPENLPVNTPIGTIFATDADMKDMLTFSLSETGVSTLRLSEPAGTQIPSNLQMQGVDSKTNATFILGRPHTMDPASVEILINKALDRETSPNGYNLTVTVTDSEHTSTVTLSVNIEDVNDNAPVFQPPSYNFTVNEEVSSTVIGTVTATDKDLHANGMLRFTVLPPWGSNFSVNQTGQVKVTSALDRETLATTSDYISLLIMATDGGKPPLMSTATVTVHVLDINDHAPDFTDTVKNISVAEKQKVSVLVKAYDEDVGMNGLIQYGIGHTNTSSLKMINGTLTSTAALAYGVYEVEVIAYNTVPYRQPGLTNGTLMVYIHVKDINDHSPLFDNTSYEFSIREDFEVGHLVHQSNIHAQDLDETREYNTVTYSMVNENGYFEVDPRNATLRLIKPLDYEDRTHIHFQVMASDGDVNHDVKVNVSVTVLDVNDHAPVFTSELYNCTVNENVTSPITCPAPTGAIDEDAAANGRILYTIEGLSGDIFTINNTTGFIYPYSPLDYDKGVRTYVMTIMATDNGSPKKTGSAVVEVTVMDKNDNWPVIHGPSQFTIPENLAVNTSVGTIFATDVDINDVLAFSLTHSTDFHIHKYTGELFSERIFDYEKESDRHIEVNVTVSDGVHTAEYPITVTVTNVNDESPVFVNSSLTPVISEDMDNPSFYIQATDADIDSSLSYTISSVTHISISRTSGLVTIAGTVNSEDNDTITFDVSVSDGAHTETATVTVHVLDVNDNAPRFENSTYTFDVDEELDNVFIGTVKATDKDVRDMDMLRYTLLPPWERNFNVTQTGQIRVTSALDRENLTTTSGQIILLVMAEDSGKPPLMAIATVSVHVQDVNDHAPHFTSNVIDISMDEGQNVSSAIQAYDDDDGINGHIYYSIEYTNATSLEMTDGILRSTDTLTFGVYMVEVIAYNTEPYTVEALVNGTLVMYIHVKDINNHKPQFNKTVYTFSLPEDFAVGQLVNQSNIHAEDQDETREYNTVTYSMDNGNGYFEVDPRNAALRLIKPLDYVDKRVINFQVMASDGDASHQVMVNVTVTVLDVNDHAPVFSSALYNCTVDENVTSPITCRAQINATDGDTGENGRLFYSIEGHSENTFTINNITGVIHPWSPLDYDTGVRSHVITILATDNGSPQQTGSAVVEVTVMDKNDNSPVIHGPSQFTIPENLTVNTSIGSIFATDADINDVLVFSLTHNRDFHIHEDTGELFSGRIFDYETESDRHIQVNVTVSDGVHNTEYPITVTVTNVNDESPVFVNSSLTPVISEDMDNPSFYIQATDDDIDSSLSYNISSFPHISISRTSGLVTIGGTVNSEDNATITFGVSVSDGEHMETATVMVHVLDVNDNAPRFENSTYTFDVDEERDSAFVGTVKATDKDPRDMDMLRYTILPPWERNFNVTQTGQIRVTSALDRENLTTTSGQIILLVMAEDSGKPPLMAIATVSVHVQDVNDHAPHFTSNVIDISMDEGQNVSSAIQAYDDDDGINGHIYYSIEYTNATSLEMTDGILRSTDTLTFGVYMVEVIAYNTEPYTVEALVNGTLVMYIHVKDINNHKPQFNKTVYTFSLPEDFAVGQLVNQSNIHAEDQDETREYNTVTYSMDNGNGYFEVDPRNAALRLIKPLDYVDKRVINFQVMASDGDASHQVMVNVTVTVLDVNDHAPVFSSALYNCTVDENVTSPITCRAQINATDGDTGENGRLFYSIEGHSENTFTINNITGVIHPWSPLDYDTGVRSHVITILATDNGSPQQTGSSVVEVTVMDKNDNSPVIHGPSQFTIPENLTVNTSIGSIFATDADINDVLVFSLTHNRDFHIHEDTGELFSGRIFDYETESDRHIQVNVTVSDGVHNTEYPITVTVTNVNDESPVFVKSSLTPVISEDMDNPSFYIQATDDDIDSSLSYNISSFPHISISRTSGLVTIGGTVNSEDNDTITFGVSVSDGEHMETATVTVHVLHVNDNAPSFENSTYAFDVDEEVNSGFVGTVKATDKDPRDMDMLRYTILPPWERNFNVMQTGHIRVTSALDRENLTTTSGQIILLVMVEDSGTPPLMSIATVSVHVQDVNDHAPHFTFNVTHISIDEGQNVSSAVQAYDEDDGINGHIYYSIGYTNVTSLELTDGILRSTDTLTYGVYMVEVIAYNTEPYTVQTLVNGTLVMFIHVKDINNHKPQFNQTVYRFSLPEDFAVGQLVKQSNIHARDQDETREYNTVTYSMVNENGYFEVDPRNAALRLIRPLDYEDKTHIHFQVMASDGDASHQVMVNVTVTVLDVNDHAPVFSSGLYNCTVDENVTLPITCPSLINATDGDTGENGRLFYSIEGHSENIFTINNITGVIHPCSPLDYDTGVRSHVITILATDNGSPQQTGSTVVEVTVKDKNDNSPVIHGPNQFTIPENLPVNTSVGTIFVTDADINDALVFWLTDNTDVHIQRNTGVLFSERIFDYEKESDRHIQVNVTVSDGVHNAEYPITVAVTNVNDESPVFVKSSLTPVISEDMDNPSFFIQATDGDFDSTLIYSISMTDSRINISSSSGLVTIKGPVSSSEDDRITFNVSVSDGDHMETATVKVHVLDVNDKAPRFENSTYTFDVDEELDNAIVGTVKANDDDTEPANRDMFYMIPAMWLSNVTINATSGDIRTTGGLDRENPSVIGDHIELMVMVVDTALPHLTGTTLVVININDANDHQPTFVQMSVSYTIPEGQCPSPLHNLTTVDKDEGKNKQTKFKIIEGQTWFDINQDSVECLGHIGVGTYTITIEAANVEPYMGNHPDNQTQTVIVNVQDVNDNDPVFDQPWYSLDLKENQTVGELNFTPEINATDADTSAEYNTVTYAIVQGNGSSFFAINPYTGQLWLTTPLDYEQEELLTLTVSASDGHVNVNDKKQHIVTVGVSITVQNINDNKPIFTTDLTTCSVLENVTGEFNCTVSATDDDAGDTEFLMYYSLKSQSQIFNVDSKTGAILVKNSAQLDYDRGVRHFDIEVLAMDGGSPQLTGSTIVSIEVVNVNDESPVFPNQTYVFEIPEAEHEDYFIGQVSATDQDDDIFGRLKYSLTNSKEIHIDSTTGDIFTSVVLDYENQEQRVITDTVTAWDGANSITATVTVSVVNVNDNNPQFINATYRTHVRENTASGQLLTQIHAFDKDNLTSLQYNIEGGNDKCGAFDINVTSGEICVHKKTCLDYERQQDYIIVVEVNDGGTPPRTSQTIVEINVIDEDDVAPTFITDSLFGIVTENEPNKTMILKMFVVDPDTPLENVTLSVNNSRFAFDNWTLYTNSQLDAEDINTYDLDISLSDGVIGHTRSQLITVNVSDVNDNTPSFNSTTYAGSIPQNAKAGSYVLTIGATDHDISNSGFTFFLSGGKGDFAIDSHSGVVTIASEYVHLCVNCTYDMDVHVVDYGEPPKSNSTQMTVRIDTSNHYPPIFMNKSYMVNVTEHQTFPDSIVNVSATDADCLSTGPCGPAGSVKYSIVSGNHGQFIINRTTGFIYVNGSLDFTKAHSYALLVEARDQADDFKTDTTEVYVNVIDVNERPHFVKNVTSVCSVEDVEAGELVGIVTASDPDDNSPYLFNKLTYTLLNYHDKFHVNATTGKIYASQNVTASFIQNVVLQFVVTDHGGLNDTTTLRLSTGTRGKPVFVKSSNYIHAKIKENTPIPVDIADVNTTTEDTGTISYHLVPYVEGFRINNATGVIKATELLDRETSPNIILTVTATNSEGVCSSLVDIEVLDVNDQSPVFQSNRASVSVLESTLVGTCIQIVSVIDRDIDPQLTFEILSDNITSFGIDSNNGSLSACVIITSSLDFEEVTNYNLTLLVNDGIFNDTMTLFVVVKDVNDNAPVFSNGTYQTAIAEDTAVGSSFYQLSASDADHLDDGKLQYNLVNDNYGQFSVHSDKGIGYVILKYHLDREVNTSYSLEVDVTDTANHTTSTVLDITVLDVNDNRPTFLEEVYNVTVDEGPNSDSLTVDTEATDSDEGSNAALEYSIISQDFGNHFVINSTTGAIDVLTSLDREDTPMYTLVIQAADGGDTSLSGTATVFVNVDDINDCAPEFLDTTYSATVMEGSPSGTSVIHLTAVDMDVLPINRNVSYSILGDSDLFGVDKDGVLTLKHEVVLGTHLTPYVIQVEATDGEYNATVNITVSIIDVNDHDPVFNETFYLFSVPENDEFAVPPSVLVGVVSASDADPGRNGQVTYSILSTDVPVFTISRINGSITTNGTLDRDRCINSRYTFTVIATDNGNATRTGFVEVTVTISDVNDNWPQFTSTHYDGDVIENSAVGTEVNIHPSILPHDIDAGDNGTAGIVFYLSTDSPFEINNKSGRIYVNNETLDRETQDTYYLLVSAIDQSGSGNNNSTSLIITLTDDNDESPVFTHNISTFTFSENVQNSYLVGTVHTSDADIDGNLTTRYDIDSGGEGRFYIDAIKGDIQVTGGLDREQKANYTLIIRASDGRNSDTAEVDIILEDANDNAPVFPTNPVVINVIESNTSLSGIHNFTATDADLGENAHLSYFINTSDTAYSMFAVSEEGMLNTSQALDRETNATYSFLVHVHDHGTPRLSANVTVICHVLDSNDNYPIFYDSQDKLITMYNNTVILEKSPIHSPVFFPYVKDKDLGTNSIVHFQLFGAENDMFDCNYNTGAVTIAKRIEINSFLGGIRGHNDTKDYVDIMLVIEATDEGHPSKSTNLTLYVTVEQISDENPVFDHNMYDFSVLESTSKGSYVGTVRAVMPNVTNYHLTYSLVIPTDILILGKASGNITLNSKLDREEAEWHAFAVQVTDGKTPERTAFTMVNIHVTDVNDNAPYFEHLPYIFTVTEGTDVLLDIGAISATDKDTGRNAMIQYSLPNYTGDIFSVNNTIGHLLINGTIDREVNTQFILIVQAEDGGSPPLNTTALVRLEVQDVNDNSPQFQRTNYTCTVYENAPYQQICNVSATDDDMGDNGTVVYSIQENNIPFYINPIDGTIWKSGLTDFETRNTYNLTIEARDLGSPMRSSTVSLVITVVDMPDTSPHFTSRLYSVTTSPFIPLHTVLLSVNAGHAGITYTLSDDPSDTFCIDHMSGALTLCKVMDSRKNTYVLTVLAEDANLTDMAVVAIHVRNEHANFKQNQFTTDVQENHPAGLLLDLNTTEEMNGVPVHYTLISVQPEETTNVFVVNQSTGAIYCNGSLDRERTKTYTLLVSAEVIRSGGRSKRSAADSLGQVTVTVRVGDENDNPPYFAVDTKHVYRVPISLQLAAKVAELQAFDPDDTSTITYSLLNGAKLPFFLESDITTRILLKSPLKLGSYHLTVSATDEGDQSSDVNVTIITIPDTDRLTYVIPMSPQVFEKQEKALIANLSSILGVNITMEGYKAHISTTVDPSKTDLLLFANNRTTGRLLSSEELSSLISAKFADIVKLFRCNDDTCYVHTVPVKHSSNVMTAPEIALLTIAVLIFVTCLLVIIAGNHIWKQFHAAREQEVKMWELESFRSDSGSHIAIAAVNSNMETSFAALDDSGNSSSGLAGNKKRSVLYESQELTMNFDNEAFLLEPPVTNGTDSGVENDSSTSSNVDDNESPGAGVYSETGPAGKAAGSEYHHQGASGSSIVSTEHELSLPSQQQTFVGKGQTATIHINMDTGDTNDDDPDIDHDTDTVAVSGIHVISADIADQSLVNADISDQSVTAMTPETDQAMNTSETEITSVHSEAASNNDNSVEHLDEDMEEVMVTSF